jgi:lambda repressor-like predicted transcriptional regulator
MTASLVNNHPDTGQAKVTAREIKAALALRGLTIRDLALHLGYSRQTVSQAIHRGHSRGMVAKIRTYLNLP